MHHSLLVCIDHATVLSLAFQRTLADVQKTCKKLCLIVFGFPFLYNYYVFHSLDDVELLDVDPKFVWKPRKRQGRHVSSSSLGAHLASGKLKNDAIKAASQLKGSTGRIPHRGQVANRLAKNFTDYSKYEASYIEKNLLVTWWKN